MSQNTTIVPISLPKDMARELDKAARNESMTRSEYIRDVLRRQVAFFRMSEFRQEFSKRAKKAGINNLAKSVSVVREARKKYKTK